MGLFDRLGLTTKRFNELKTPYSIGIASPYVEGTGGLSQLVFGDILGEDVSEKLPMSRADAITIPAVSKARNLLVSTISQFPLVALKGDARVPQQPSWLYRTDSGVSPYERMAWTVDDLIFLGASLWVTERGSEKQITNAEWVPPQDWKITDGFILVNDEPVDDSEVILFNSPFEGLLNIASRTLRGARDLERAWTARMKNPINITEFRVVDDTNLEQDEVDEWEAAWLAKHKSGEPSFGVTPAGVELHTHGEENGDSSMYLESRNAVRTDVGSFLNVRASMLDGTAGVDSLTYTTSEGERNSFYEFDLPFWTSPIEAALSQDKCVPRGTRVRFDKYELYAPTPSPTGAPMED